MNAVFLVYGILSVALYAYVSLREKTYINALSAFFAFYFFTSFVLEPFFFEQDVYQYDVNAFAFVYLCDFANFFGMAVAYTAVAGVFKANRIPIRRPAIESRLGIFAWAFLGISALMFLPVAIEFRELVFSDPRALYALTRIGYGQYLFISVLMGNLSVICFLFSARKGVILFVPFVVLLTLFKGAKGPILVILEIYATWAVYVRGVRVALGKFVLSAVAVIAVMTGLFAVTLRGVDSSVLLIAIAGYSDYNRNAALTVTEPIGPFYGRLALENWVYSRIPRVLDPNKPKNFGQYYLAEHYLPAQFAAEAGAPPLGAGNYIADFGTFTPVFMLFMGLCGGYFLGLCVEWLRRGGGVAAFVPLLYFSSISLIPIPMAFLGVEHWLIGLCLGKASRLKLRAIHAGSSKVGSLRKASLGGESNVESPGG
jgi:hypothetical protein